MQAKTFYVNVRNAGFNMTLAEVAQMIEDWYSFYPEVKEILNLQIDGYVPASTFERTKSSDLEEADDDELEEEVEYEDNGPQTLLRDAQGNILEDENRMVKLFKTTNALGMVKARGTKCAVANFNFQSYAAAANKIAMWWVYYTEWARAKQLNTPQRFTIVNFIHERSWSLKKVNCWKPKSKDMVISRRAVPIRQTAGVQKGSETIPQGSRAISR